MSNDVFVGLDWAVHTHAVCLIDAAGSVLERFEVTHDHNGLADLMRRLARHGQRLRIAIERPSGLIVDALVDAGHEVFPIHPNAVKASRPRYRSHGAKSDATDAYLLADLLRTDGHRWRALAPQSDDIRALRALVRSRDDLVAARIAAANQLTSTLQAFWPGAAVIFADVASPIALAFLRRYPSPSSAKRLSEAQLQRFCKAQHYSGHRSAAELLQRLRSAAAGHAGKCTERALAEAGAVPVTYQSGKTRSVAFRWACNHRLRQAITCLADNSRHANAWAKSVYQAARARGCDHTHAVRILARAWLRVIWRAWTDRKPYDPSLHGNAAALASATGG